MYTLLEVKGGIGCSVLPMLMEEQSNSATLVIFKALGLGYEIVMELLMMLSSGMTM